MRCGRAWIAILPIGCMIWWISGRRTVRISEYEKGKGRLLTHNDYQIVETARAPLAVLLPNLAEGDRKENVVEVVKSAALHMGESVHTPDAEEAAFAGLPSCRDRDTILACPLLMPNPPFCLCLHLSLHGYPENGHAYAFECPLVANSCWLVMGIASGDVDLQIDAEDMRRGTDVRSGDLDSWRD